jgi:aryl-alcohol dehydrogenase-like predicted oxidoreductase
MRYKAFGRRTGLRVSELALGAGNFGTGWGHGTEPDEARPYSTSTLKLAAISSIPPMVPIW